MIPYGKQTISEADIAAVVATLKSPYLTQGNKVPEFEQALAQYCGAKYAVSVNSATSALHIACLALGLGTGDVLWTTPTTFVASANCALYCGASVDFVDIDPKTFNISIQHLAEKLAQAKIAGCLPKIVVPVHLCGEPCDMAAIKQLADEYGFKIIEDASHAIGASYRGGKVGNCEFSDITVFSFHPVKIITTAEGGLASTNNADLANKMARLRSHGITRESSEMVGEPDGSWYYQQIDLGYNYRMTEMQAALGLSQLSRLDEFVARRHVLAAQYDDLLADLPVGLPFRQPENVSALHLYPVLVALEKRRQVFDYLRQNGIGVNVHYIPVHTQPYYREQFGFAHGDFPNAEHYYAQAISLPLYFDLSDDEQKQVVETLKRALQVA
ncbi:UDP-4-amino-4,6-dideoxy-N-acetyl-beta-L-altrosamine transaminase [Wielerella bovis]|uniref:UDP-4-amino-4, 6-dideoxy-N-acetyl-beta-L-altrosamine transaminase n=1 Tax=Wielerella bovis TaxID=2917790 RepID=UPI0020189AD6|nr:UDP-4-amino-4,6-dideoxy-N-acetyl-beta-L-altrosamine transaminase [Wielerella bovis]ULJ65677.1 UDP-4-amino-4,6-dideoxy-N-acetyl-beta-L-altrosamine transaminase [Wielerella bovis]ULJ66280.1 UDP-4-amino-4,6-dideoxy-N-acetyl-beta-L-altrosamine transaminase [Wielerella bovis]